ncbi:MAG: 2-oxoglutarate dehydrogenase E1 component [Zetaproteobacteria bacterium CG_4_9_14_3_um_filter_53_7]|nr:MAG: 2-oxoglutarate dehydrogenase E1 component [Zetaproteobacteria bacterium CG_4_9_14_3_um_filter_53_7]
MSQSKPSDTAIEDELFSAGSSYLEQLQEQYDKFPETLPAGWAEYFSHQHDSEQPEQASHKTMLEKMRPQSGTTSQHFDDIATLAKQGDIEYPSRAIYLIHAYRLHGHLHARLDPLGLNPKPASPELELAYYGLSAADLDQQFPTGDLTGDHQMPLGEIIKLLKQTYCGHIGPEFMHITNSARRHWLQSRLERIRSTADYDADTRRHIFGRIMHAEEFERFLHTRYVGQKRFSLEGGESLIPMLDAMVQKAGRNGIREIIMGMAHRGRLNVLANIMGKSLSDIFSEFEGGAQFQESAQGQGDVKYHMGFSSDVRTPGGVVHLSLGFNPSHLEIITPVVLGSVRARQCRRKDKNKTEVMSVLVHGDAAFAGQGVVAESLQLSKLRGFRVGGTIHIVVNNQIGFTVNPFDARSTTYCTDIAKIVQAPILHVNGDDPEACSLVAEIAIEYRNTFHEDIVIDLICYRRHGHNEADSPEVTQPVMYRRIGELQTVEQLYRDQMIKEGVLTAEDCDSMVSTYRDCLEKVRRANRPAPSPVNSLQGRWEGFVFDGAEEPDTSVTADQLSMLARKVHRLPAGFSMHAKVEKIYESRIQMMDGKLDVDWGCGETMAYATLVFEGGWVRLSGEDSGRGTFFHRHAVVYDQKTGKGVIPLRQVENGTLSHFIVVDSILSEVAVMGYEYGYSVAEPRALVIWEAQYGDFANVGQVVIDQFIAAGETKWNRMSGLVLWLPHGFEGQGAEHSSARLERYLQLCAEKNMQVAYPTTPAQLFHLLRRQLMSKVRKPLILMSPKSMLRNKLSFSALQDFTSGAFQSVLAESDAAIKPAQVRRLIICSGKVYYDLLAERQNRGITDIAMIRLERIYPFPAEALRQQLEQYTSVSEVFWVQEEPQNQGAWLFVNSLIRQVLLEDQKIYGLSRPASAAPAVGSAKRHKDEVDKLMHAAFADGVEDLLV